MAVMNLEPCPDCGALLPPSSGVGHRYVGASAACWELFAALNNAGEPPLVPSTFNGLLTDAYMVQHPGVPSPQAIQSVAVHLLALYGVLERGVDPGRGVVDSTASSGCATWTKTRPFPLVDSSLSYQQPDCARYCAAADSGGENGRTPTIHHVYLVALGSGPCHHDC